MKASIYSYCHQKQRDSSDCGVACLASALRYHVGFYPLESLRQYSGTNQTGTTMLGLIQCANKIGFEADGFEAKTEHLKECKDICILHIIKDKILQHYVIFYGYDEISNTFIIGDPSESNPIHLSEDELSKVWQSGALLRLIATENIPKRKQQNKSKWIYNLLKEDWNILLMALILGVLVAILSLSTAVFSQKFIDTLLPSNEMSKIVIGSILLLLLMLINGFFSYIKELFLVRQGKDFNIRIISFFYTKLVHLPKRFFDNRKIGDLVARINDTNRIQSTITNFICGIVINFLMVTVSSVAIFSYNIKLESVSNIWLPMFLFVVWAYHPRI